MGQMALSPVVHGHIGLSINTTQIVPGINTIQCVCLQKNLKHCWELNGNCFKSCIDFL